MSQIEKLERYFEKSFERIIEEEHWGAGISINRLSLLSGVIRQSIMHAAKVRGIRLMNSKEISARLIRVGPWLGKKNPAHSKRMRLKNPSKRKDVRIRMSASIAETFRKNQLPQEIAFAELLMEKDIPFCAQYPIEQYIIDFFIPDRNLCIEIDSTAKWGRERKATAAKKDRWLKRRGYSVLRINKKLLSEKRLILDILSANNLIRN